MTKIIKKVIVKEFKRIQNLNVSEINIARLTLDLYISIIINVSIGFGYEDVLIDYENDDGTIDKIQLQESINRLISVSFDRYF